MTFAHTRELPTHKLGGSQFGVLDNKDISHELKMALSEKAGSGFFMATNVANIVSSPEMQARFMQAGIHKSSISVSTAWHWLSKLGWHYGRHQNGMYVDGHEHEDVVEYRQAFVKRFKIYKLRFHTWDNTGISFLMLQASLHPVQPNTTLLFSSPMTNLSSIKTTNDRLTGVALAVEL